MIITNWDEWMEKIKVTRKLVEQEESVLTDIDKAKLITLLDDLIKSENLKIDIEKSTDRQVVGSISKTHKRITDEIVTMCSPKKYKEAGNCKDIRVNLVQLDFYILRQLNELV